MKSLGLVALLLVVIPMCRWFWRAFKVDIPRQTSLYAMAWGGGAILGLLSLLAGGGAAAAWALGVGATLFYLINTGSQYLGSSAIAVGDTIPKFTASDDKGETFDSAELAGTPVLIKFFRGHW